MGSYRNRSLIEGLYTLWKPYTLNSPPVVSFKWIGGLHNSIGVDRDLGLRGRLGWGHSVWGYRFWFTDFMVPGLEGFSSSGLKSFLLYV